MSLTSCRMMVMSLNRISKRLPFSEWNFKYTTKNGFFEKKKMPPFGGISRKMSNI